MKTIILHTTIILAAVLSLPAFAVDSPINFDSEIDRSIQAPKKIDRISYLRFANQAGLLVDSEGEVAELISFEDAENNADVDLELLREEIEAMPTLSYYSEIFDWHEKQQKMLANQVAKGQNLGPAQIAAGKAKIVIDTESGKDDARKIEGAGLIKLASTWGADVYQVFDAKVRDVLKVYLYRAGVPIDGKEGITYPKSRRYSFRKEISKTLWDDGVILNKTIKHKTMLFSAWNDYYIVMVRKVDDKYGKGYDMLTHFIGRADGELSTQTKSSVSVSMFRETKDGKTLVLSNARYVGPVYPAAAVGGLLINIDTLRDNFGFSPVYAKEEMDTLRDMVEEYTKTGKIEGGARE